MYSDFYARVYFSIILGIKKKYIYMPSPSLDLQIQIFQRWAWVYIFYKAPASVSILRHFLLRVPKPLGYKRDKRVLGIKVPSRGKML